MVEEEVLVIPTRILHEVGLFQGLCRDVARYEPRLLDPRHFSYLPRSLAEDDPGYKQLIPYVVLKCGDLVFHYTRGKGGGEKRLRSLRSIGIGGHINPGDEAAGDHPYRRGLARELAEEIVLESSYRDTCLGFINDDSLPVGQVHLGVVHIFELAEPKARRRELDIMQAGFAPLAELRLARDSFETWSQFVLDELARETMS